MHRRNLLITSALKDEILPLKNGIGILQYQNININYFISGIGKEKSIARLSEKLKNQQYDLVLNIGTAGSLMNNFQIGDIIFPSEFLSTTNESLNIIKIEPVLLNMFDDQKLSKIFTSEKPVNKKIDKDLINQKTHAEIVDMESFWIAQLCKEKGIDFLSIKVISDFAENITMAEFKKNLKITAKLLLDPTKNILRTYNDRQ